MKTNNKWIIKPGIPEEIYTDRDHHLTYFYNAALRTASRRASSTVFLGLIEVVTKSRHLFPFTDIFDTILMWYDAIVRRKEPLCHALALKIPRKVSDIDDTSIAVFIDEFQNTRLPQYN
jgi:hypothetical protein